MTFKASELNTEFSLSDKLVLAGFVFTRNIRGILYDKESNRFEVDNSLYAINKPDGSISIQLSENFEVITEDTGAEPYLLKCKSTGDIFPPMTSAIIVDDEELLEPSPLFAHLLSDDLLTDMSEHDFEYRKIVSLDEFTPYAQGKLWDKYLSEVVIVPFLNESGEIDFDNEHVKNYFDYSGNEETAKYYVDQNLIWHPLTGTWSHMSIKDGKENGFDTDNLNMPYSSDTIQVALTSPFDWALTECDYAEK